MSTPHDPVRDLGMTEPDRRKVRESARHVVGLRTGAAFTT
jgi:hypothetical protein